MKTKKNFSTSARESASSTVTWIGQLLRKRLAPMLSVTGIVAKSARFFVSTTLNALTALMHSFARSRQSAVPTQPLDYAKKPLRRGWQGTEEKTVSGENWN